MKNISINYAKVNNWEIKDWSAYLQGEEKEEDLDIFRKHERTGRPLGDEDFITRIEKITGRTLRKKKAGRPKKKERNIEIRP